MISFLPIGSIHERSVEQEVIDIAVNNKSVFQNVSVVVKRFSVTHDTTLFHKGKNVRRKVITTPFKFKTSYLEKMTSVKYYSSR